ncbi:MAG: hypothetical protein LBG94_07655 [Treponema sp.]|jgi:hypothetical protein|nr:hypothetical protein [Treponema sp.]
MKKTKRLFGTIAFITAIVFTFSTCGGNGPTGPSQSTYNWVDDNNIYALTITDDGATRANVTAGSYILKIILFSGIVKIIEGIAQNGGGGNIILSNYDKPDISINITGNTVTTTAGVIYDESGNTVSMTGGGHDLIKGGGADVDVTGRWQMKTSLDNLAKEMAAENGMTVQETKAMLSMFGVTDPVILAEVEFTSDNKCLTYDVDKDGTVSNTPDSTGTYAVSGKTVIAVDEEGTMILTSSGNKLTGTAPDSDIPFELTRK